MIHLTDATIDTALELLSAERDEDDRFELDGEEYDIRFDYSGRFMYGERCIGITGRTFPAAFPTALAIAVLKDEGYEDPAASDILDMLTDIGSPNWDDMGLSTIWYWPGLTITDQSLESTP